MGGVQSCMKPYPGSSPAGVVELLQLIMDQYSTNQWSFNCSDEMYSHTCKVSRGTGVWPIFVELLNNIDYNNYETTDIDYNGVQ